jgi:hypothetical protein
MKIPARMWTNPHPFGNLLFDLKTDPHQDRPLSVPALEARMSAMLMELMRANDAPLEQFERLGL